jgi:hypothetical protein
MADHMGLAPTTFPLTGERSSIRTPDPQLGNGDGARTR